MFSNMNKKDVVLKSGPHHVTSFSVCAVIMDASRVQPIKLARVRLINICIIRMYKVPNIVSV